MMPRPSYSVRKRVDIPAPKSVISTTFNARKAREIVQEHTDNMKANVDYFYPKYLTMIKEYANDGATSCDLYIFGFIEGEAPEVAYHFEDKYIKRIIEKLEDDDFIAERENEKSDKIIIKW